MNDQACKNTDRELFREPDQGMGDYYSNSVHVSEQGMIGMNVGGRVIVLSIKTWHKIATEWRGEPQSIEESIGYDPLHT